MAECYILSGSIAGEELSAHLNRILLNGGSSWPRTCLVYEWWQLSVADAVWKCVLLYVNAPTPQNTKFVNSTEFMSEHVNIIAVYVR